MSKVATTLVQIVFAVVALHATACSTTQTATKQAEAPKHDAEAELVAKLRLLESQGPLYFDTDTEVLTESSQEVLLEVAGQMFAHPKTRVIITGHADERGDTAYNLALGERRAEAARTFLTRLGIPKGRIRILSLGEEVPLLNGHDEGAWAVNRRDEFTFILPREATAEAGLADDAMITRIMLHRE